MTSLHGVAVRRIVRAVADAAARWADADFPPRVRLLDPIVERTGYSLPVVEYALDQLFASITVDALEATIADELGSLDVLDAPQTRVARPAVQALPAGSVCIISSRTTIGVAIAPAVLALCAKCDVLVKDREDGLVRAFFSTLHEELDQLRNAARAERWNGDEDAVDLHAFDAIVAFGKDSTLTTIARAAAPRPLIGFGSKATIGYVTRATLEDETRARAAAAGAARDLVLYESEGCLSLHALFVEEGGRIGVQTFCELLAREVERAEIEFPPGARDAHATARLASARNLAAFRSATGAGAVFSNERATYLAVLDPPHSEPPAFLPRALAVRSVHSPADALAYLRRHELPIEAVAADVVDDAMLAFAIEAGANRIAPFGALQRPPLAGNHGGRARIADFVRWLSIDTYP